MKKAINDRILLYAYALIIITCAGVPMLTEEKMRLSTWICLPIGSCATGFILGKLVSRSKNLLRQVEYDKFYKTMKKIGIPILIPAMLITLFFFKKATTEPSFLNNTLLVIGYNLSFAIMVTTYFAYFPKKKYEEE